MTGTRLDSLAKIERAAICDTFDLVGPDAPTLCEGWLTRDLAAHLILREGSVAALGIRVKPLAGWTHHVQDRISQRSWANLVQRVRAGAPTLSPFSNATIDKDWNSAEFFVHHEDVRRAAEGWTPRELAPGHERFLWAALRRRAKFHFAPSPVGTLLRNLEGEAIVARSGQPRVIVTGKPSELLLLAYGRGDHAIVTVEGEDGDVKTFRGTRLRA
jgi:uncharacterized protein (TIGR03085 family)